MARLAVVCRGHKWPASRRSANRCCLA